MLRNLFKTDIYMECPICSAELEDCGSWGYLAQHQSGEVLGHTFKCPNAEGFETKEEAYSFLQYYFDEILSRADADKWLKQHNDRLGDITCPSSAHSVSGSFYTDKQENLHEGYPC